MRYKENPSMGKDIKSHIQEVPT